MRVYCVVDARMPQVLYTRGNLAIEAILDKGNFLTIHTLLQL